MKFLSANWRVVFPALALVLLTSCGSSQDQFYRLSATGAAPTGGSGLSVSVGPVSLPSYIDRSELVFQNAPNEFALPTHVRWIGSLSENISRVLAADLGRILPSSRVHTSLDPGAADYSVAIDIRLFHGISGKDAVLDLSWRIQDAKGQTLSRHNGNFQERIIGDGYDPLVAAESRLLAQAARAMASSLRSR